MGHTYASNYVHCVFSTKQRSSLIPRERQSDLYGYMAGIAKSEGFGLLEVGGTANHVHLLILLPATYPLAQAVRKIKGGSSRWMGTEFAWQEGYGAFSVSPSQVSVVRQYIRSQEEHHGKRSFEEEFVSLLRHCGLEFDKRYVFG
jgi:putative transposase